jgi:hypothetical protein
MTLILLTSCDNKKRLNRRVSLWRLDKIPYGTKYSFDNLPFIFPDADIRTSSRFPLIYQNRSGDDTTRAIIIVSPKFDPEPDEMSSLVRYASSGNQVFISALSFKDTVMSMLHLTWRNRYYMDGDSTTLKLLDPEHPQWINYTYPGYSNDAWFDSIDTGYTTILGKDAFDRPDFIRISYAHGGAIFIHLNPFAFSNFFLLHGKNKSYYDLALSNMSSHIRVVEWSDYFRYEHQDDNFSALRFILSNKSLRWAFWLTILLFLIFFLVESKRKQRAITEIPALRNASEDFVKTVGRLYFQQKNNQNLAEKMVAAFLENVRSAYNLSTSILNDEFAHKLAFRTGRPLNEIREIVRLIHESRLQPDLSDQQLMDLHYQINQFNKPA